MFICLPFFQHHLESTKKDLRRIQDTYDSSTLDSPIRVYQNYGTRNLTTNYSHSMPQTSWNQYETFIPPKTSNDTLTNIELVSFTISISADARTIISAAWRGKTKLKYNSTLKTWTNFCSKEWINLLHPDTEYDTESLTQEFKIGWSCYSLVSIRSVVGHYCLPYDIVNHNIIFTFLKGVNNLRPPKCFAIWDASILLSQVRNKDISAFYDITKKWLSLYDSYRHKGSHSFLAWSNTSKGSRFWKLNSSLIYDEIGASKMKELIQEFRTKKSLITISVTGNFSNMKFGSSISIILKIMPKIQKVGLI